MSPTRTSCCCLWSPPPLNERAFADAQIVLEGLCARRAVPRGVVDARDGAIEMARMSAVMNAERMHASECGCINERARERERSASGDDDDDDDDSNKGDGLKYA